MALGSESVVPAEETFRVRAGTVIIATEQNQGLTIVGAVEIGARDGVVVFKPPAARSEAMPEGGWPDCALRKVWHRLRTEYHHEYAGVWMKVQFPSLTPVSFEGLTVQAGTTSVSTIAQPVRVLGARFANVDNTAPIRDSVTISQLAWSDTRAPVPVDANVRAFGRLPIGAEHDWGTDHAGIQLRGTTGTMVKSTEWCSLHNR